jgi:hypothetical protein
MSTELGSQLARQMWDADADVTRALYVVPALHTMGVFFFVFFFNLNMNAIVGA